MNNHPNLNAESERKSTQQAVAPILVFRSYTRMINFMRWMVVAGVIARFSFHANELVSPIGRSILYATALSVATYCIASAVLTFWIKNKTSRARRHGAGWLAGIDVTFITIFSILSLNVDSDLHLALIVPITTVILESGVRRLRTVLAILTPSFIASILGASLLLGVVPGFKDNFPEPNRSWFKVLVTTLIPRLGLWSAVAMPLLVLRLEIERQIRDTANHARANKKLARQVDRESLQIEKLYSRLKTSIQTSPGNPTLQAAMPGEKVSAETYDYKLSALERIWEELQQRNEELLAANKNLQEAQMEMSRQAEFWRTLMDHLPYAVFWKDKELRFRYVDNKLAKDLKVSRSEDLYGKTDADIFGTDDFRVAIYQESDKEALEGITGRVERYEPHYALSVNPMEARFDWIHTTKFRIRMNDEILGVLGICREADKEMEAEFYSRVLDASGLCLFWKNNRGEFVSVNAPFVASTGKQRSEIIGRTDRELFPKDADDFERIDKLLKSRELAIYDEVELHHFDALDGEARWVRCVKVAIFNDVDDAMGIQGAFWDIQQCAEESERFVKWFLHDANKPLVLIKNNFFDKAHAAINRCSSWCDRSGHAESEIVRDLNVIGGELSNILSASEFLATQFFAFGVLRHEWTGESFTPLVTDVNLRETVDSLLPLIGENYGSAIVDVQIPEDLGTIRSDANVIRAAFWILLENALKKHDEKRDELLAVADGLPAAERKELREVARRWRGKIVVSFERTETHLHLRVSDQGIGATAAECAEFSGGRGPAHRTSKFGAQILRFFSQQLRGGQELQSEGLRLGATAHFWIARSLEPFASQTTK